MAEATRIRRALLSVYDKTGLVEFARVLHQEFGIELISTGGTAKTLKEAGLPVTLVEELTGSPEMLDGRVKTLHPRIHAAILADRDNPEHMRQLREQGIEPIDMVVVNLYPFEQTIAQPDCTFEQAIEMIDIGGPCLLRAAAKNHRHVAVFAGYSDPGAILECLRRDQARISGDVRRLLAAWAYDLTSAYDRRVRRYLEPPPGGGYKVPVSLDLQLRRVSGTRYGENPHQIAGRYVDADATVVSPLLRNYPDDRERAVSFNNLVDASAALELCAELTRAKMLHKPGTAKLCFAEGTRSSASRDEHLSNQSSSAVNRAAHLRPVRDDLVYERNLPHWQPPGATFLVSLATHGSALAEPERDIVLRALRHWDGIKLDLHAAVVMPTHVHALLTPRELPNQPRQYYNLFELLQSIKAFSGREISQARGGAGQVWERESFDRWVRSRDDFLEKWRYVTENPVKEGLAETPEQYRWWYAVDVLGTGTGVPVTAGTAQPPVLDEVGVLREAELRGPQREAELRDPQLRGPQLGESGPATCVFIKHTNACGVAVAADPVEAYRKAYRGDPNAALGGILAVNFSVDAAFAEAVMETYARWGKPLKDAGMPYAPGGFFVEVWVAPSFDDEAVRVIRGEEADKPQKDWGKRVRLLAVGDLSAPPDPTELDYKRIAGEMLVQTRDLVGLNEEQWQVVTKRAPTEQELADLRLAWLICKHTKSNAVTICRDGMLLGNGAGQMSRVMSCRIATWLARENGHADSLRGAVAASDAFFPFRDGPGILADAGVTALVQPGGSKRDADTIAACDERGLAMICTGTRHFRH